MKERNGTGPIVHHESKQPQRAMVEFLAFWFAPEITVRGVENLKETRQLITEDKKIIFIANHLSHADYTIFHQSLKRNGFGEIAERTIPFSGLRVENNPATKLLTPAYNRTLIWSSTVAPQNEEEGQRKLVMDRETLKYTKWNLMNGYHSLIFAEGTRSKTATLAKGEHGVVHFFNLVDNTFVVPVGISGTEKILPPGSLIPDRGYPTVTFGKPIDVRVLNQRFSHITNKSERQKATIDFVMFETAQCVPKQYQGVYAET